MKVLFLCAGFGTRLEKDLEASGEFPELRGRSKALLPINEKALISFWFDSIKDIEQIGREVAIVTNDKFTEEFYKSRRWYAEGWDSNFISGFPIINNGVCSNETRMGAVADIKTGIDQGKMVGQDVLVIAGDTLFMDDFQLEDFLKRFNDLKAKHQGQPLALIVECPCPEEEVHKHGIIEVGEDGLVTSFLEKPKASDTKSRSQSPCFYAFSPEVQGILEEFLEANKDAPLEKKDATGNFLAFLIPKAKVYAFKTKGRFDVGNLASYKFCIENKK